MKSTSAVNVLFALAAPAAAYTSLSYTNVSDPYYGQSPPVYPSREIRIPPKNPSLVLI
jgi:beta-glucosidase